MKRAVIAGEYTGCLVSRFAEYSPRSDDVSRLDSAQGLIIRAARADDSEELGRISAARSGGDPRIAANSFKKLIARSARTGRALVLTAEWEGRVIGFGKCKYFTPRPDAPANVAPEGWYLTGLIVTPNVRRRGVGRALTEARLEWIASRSGSAYYFANALNRVSIELHGQLGFVETTRDFAFPGVVFEGGPGVLYRCELPR
jgi:GNAT superfamily N-acetyltransferase